MGGNEHVQTWRFVMLFVFGFSTLTINTLFLVFFELLPLQHASDPWGTWAILPSIKQVVDSTAALNSFV